MSFYVLISFYSYTIPRFPQKDRYQWHKIKTAWWDATRRLGNTFRASVRTAFCALQSLSCGESLWVYDVTFRWGCKWVKEQSRVLQNQISLAVSNQDKKKKKCFRFLKLCTDKVKEFAWRFLSLTWPAWWEHAFFILFFFFYKRKSAELLKIWPFKDVDEAKKSRGDKRPNCRNHEFG